MKANPNSPTHDQLLRFLILNELDKAGGAEGASMIKERILRKWVDKQSEGDRQDVASGSATKFENNIGWARKHLVIEGDLRADSPQGIWEMTEKGRATHKRQANYLSANLSTGPGAD